MSEWLGSYHLLTRSARGPWDLPIWLRPTETNAAIPDELDRIVTPVTVEAPDDRHQSSLSLSAEPWSVAVVRDVRSGDKEPPAG